MRGAMLIPIVLKTLTYSASGSDTVQLNTLPKQWMGRLAHLAKITFDCTLTPTYSSGTGSVVGTNNIITRLEVYDGSFLRFQGGFNTLRQFERLESGGVRVADPDTDTASASARFWRRTWHAGPPKFAGGISDFALPCGMLENGELRVTYGALTDIDANCTAATGSVKIVAWVVLYDELHIPPAYERTTYAPGAADFNVTGRSLYAFLGMGNSSAWDAIAAGDFGNVTVDLGQGQLVNSLDAEILCASYNDDFGVGEFGGLQGEPRATADDNTKQANRASPTAIVGQTADHNPVLWSGPGARITKLHKAESVLRIRWDGSQASAFLAVGRFLEQPPTVIAQRVAESLGKLALRDSGTAVNVLKKPTDGVFKAPVADYMPYKIKVSPR